MKFVVLSNASLGYRQTHLSPKKMNKKTPLLLFSLLPADIKIKIVKQHEELMREVETECPYCKACKFNVPNYLLKKTQHYGYMPYSCLPCSKKFEIMREFCNSRSDEGRGSWRNMKAALNESGGGFIIKHRYCMPYGRGGRGEHDYYYSQSPLNINNCNTYKNHKVVIIYINFIKVNRKTIKYVSEKKILIGNETMNDMKEWFNECKNSDTSKIGRVNTLDNNDICSTDEGYGFNFHLGNICLLDC